MQTTTLCRSGVFSTATRWSPTLPVVPERRGGLAGIGQQRLAERRIGPGACHDAGADMRPDLGFVGLDDRVERRGIGVALLDQDGLQGADPQFGFRELGGLVVVVPMVVPVVVPVMVMRGHGRS